MIWTLVSAAPPVVIEVWRDDFSGRLWAQPLKKSVFFRDAAKVCASISDQFEVPTIDDLLTADAHGIRTVFGLDSDQFWSSTPGKTPACAMVYDAWNSTSLDVRTKPFLKYFNKRRVLCSALPHS